MVVRRVRRSQCLLLAAVVFLCGILYFVGNGRVALWDRDEPRYAMASRWMVRSGDWIVPRMGWSDHPETPRTAKPAGIYWLQGGAMKLLGETVFAARLPSAVATTLLLAGLGILISRYYGPARAIWTVLVLGTCAILVVASKMCVTDTVLLLWITLGQVCLLAIYRGNRSPWVAATFWVAVGLGGLIKGPVVLGVYLTTLIVLAIFDTLDHRDNVRDSTSRPAFAASIRDAVSWWRWTRPVMGLILLALIVGPWLVAVHAREPHFLSAAVSHDVLERMKSGLEDHTGPPGFYVATLFGTFFPWSLLLPLTLIIAWKRKRFRKDVRFALAAAIGPWILMELVRTKLVHYVLPIFPPLAFLVSDMVLRGLRDRHDGLVSRFASYGVAAWAVVVAVAASLPWLAARYYHPVPGAAMAVLSAVGLVYAVVVAVSFWKRKPGVGLAVMGIGFAAFCAVGFGWFVPNAEFLRLSPRIGARLVAEGATGPSEVIMTGYKERSLAWYQGGTIDEVWANFFSQHPVTEWPRWAVITPAVWAQIPSDRQPYLSKVATFTGLNYPSGRWVEVWIVKKSDALTTSPAPSN